MNATKPNMSWKSHLRITAAITGKDILDAIRNKNIIGLLASVLFIVVFYRFLPVLENMVENPYLLVYDAGESALVAFLENSQAVELYTYPSEDEMKNFLRRGETPELGLVIPAGFDQSLEAGQPLPLQGYVLNWVTAEQARELESQVEGEIARLVGQPVIIQMDGNVVYLTSTSDGLGVSVGIALGLVVIMTGLNLIPHLMMEEKKAHTIETLLISPASPVHVVTAKALTGLFYCMLGAAIGLAVNYFLVLHWWLALLAVLFGSLFSVTLGLFLGTLVEDRSQLALWTWVFILPLILPLILSVMEELLPAAILPVMRVIPMTVMFNLLRASFAYSNDWQSILLGCAWLLVCAGLGLGAVTWLIRRQSRQNESSPLVLRSTFSAPAPTMENHPTSKVTAASLTRAAPGGRFQAAGKNITERGKPPQASSLQIIATISAKDIRDAIRNKMLASIMLGVVLLVGTGLAFPLILGLRDTPAAVVYDPGKSTILQGLAASEDFRLLVVDSQVEMEERVGAAMEVALGLVLPEDFDQRAGSGESIELEGYFVHWAKPKKVAETVSFFEKRLSQGTWGEVHISLASEPLYPSARPEGVQNQMVTATMAIAILTMGTLLAPLLIIEEKESHTFEALLVSPASFTQVITGKALAGAAYCLAAVLAVLLLTGYLVAQWHIMLPAILLGTFFAVGLGTLLGLLTESQASLGVWGGLVLMALLSVVIFQFFDLSKWSPVMQVLVNFFPTTALSRLVGIGLAGQIPPDILWQSTFSLLALSIVIYLLVAWALRRSRH